MQVARFTLPVASSEALNPPPILPNPVSHILQHYRLSDFGTDLVGEPHRIA